MAPRNDGVVCSARSKQTGAPCKLSPVVGGTVCRFHGGNAGRLRAKIARVALETDVRRVLAQLDVIPVDDPLTELSRLAGQVVAFKDKCAELVNKLEDKIRYEDVKGSEQLRSEVVVWERALDRCTLVLGTMARLRIDERLAAISEKQAAIVLAAIDAALDAINVPRDQRPTARQAAARHLRLVPSSA
jgi:hypothetical protein